METPPSNEPAAPPPPPWLQVLHRVENYLVILPLAAMVLLPCAEIVSRRILHEPLPGAIPVVQHLVLLLSMFGGSLAARQGRLLTISTLSHNLKGAWQTAALVLSHAFAATVCGVLCCASVAVVEQQMERTHIIAWGIPRWTLQASMVFGYGLIALRLLWHGGTRWTTRAATTGLAVLFALALILLPIPATLWRWPALSVLFLATLLGAPIFTMLGGAAAILLWTTPLPDEATALGVLGAIPLNHYGLSTNPMFPTIPLFTLAGYFLAEGGAARRLIEVFNALFGRFRGGPAVVTVLVCAFFTSFTGASGVTILALGGLLMPILLAAGYAERSALGLLTCAGSLGLLFPPCLPPILYSIVASGGGSGSSVRMEQVFQGGLLPGILLVALTGFVGHLMAPRREAASQRFNVRAAFAALNRAKWDLLVPVVAITALFSGLATPVEAAAVTAAYAFAVEALIHRDLNLRQDVPRVITECGLLMGGVLLILGVALGFTAYLIDAQIPEAGVEWVTRNIHSPLVFLLMLNLFLLVVGCLMDIYSAIVVVVPLLVPIARAFDIDPIHLGVIFLANLELGFLTPPVGMNLFLSSYRFNKPMHEVARSVLPTLGVLFVGVLLITYVPLLSTWLPNALR